MSQSQQDPMDGDPIEETFFSQPPSLPAEAFEDDDWEPSLPMNGDSRRAMRATVAMLVGGAVLLGSYTVYAKVIMPAPVQLGPASMPPPPVPMVAPPPEELAPKVDMIGPSPGQAPSAAAEPVAEPEVAEAAPEPELAASPTPSPQAPPQAEAASEPVVTAAAAPTPMARKPARSRPAVAARPRRPASKDPVKLAYRALNRGEASLARNLAMRAVRDNPSRGDAYIVLGAARDRLGDKAGANAAYRMCTSRAQGAHVAACRSLSR